MSGGDLEFELEENTRNGGTITYTILRKGIAVGLMVLETPYNEERAIKRLMTMHNNINR